MELITSHRLSSLRHILSATASPRGPRGTEPKKSETEKPRRKERLRRPQRFDWGTVAPPRPTRLARPLLAPWLPPPSPMAQNQAPCRSGTPPTTPRNSRRSGRQRKAQRRAAIHVHRGRVTVWQQDFYRRRAPEMSRPHQRGAPCVVGRQGIGHRQQGFDAPHSPRIIPVQGRLRRAHQSRFAAQIHSQRVRQGQQPLHALIKSLGRGDHQSGQPLVPRSHWAFAIGQSCLN